MDRRDVKRFFILTALALFAAASAQGLPGGREELQTPATFFKGLQSRLESRDIDGYLELFSPGLRAAERDALGLFFDDLKMDSVRLHLSGNASDGPGRARLYLQVYFQNSYAAMIEGWQLALDGGDGRWRIAGKTVTGNIANLYKIVMPSGRAERARSVDIVDRDIRLSFKDAAVFYDNVPDIETALIVVGKGTVEFKPSNANERHQLELLYKKPFLQDRLDYVYVRGSNSFFSNGVRIDKDPAATDVSQAERDKAAYVFARNYARSFTIRNSLDGELLSFPPQGEEAVFEFKGRKAGELTYVYSPFSDEEVNLFDRSRDRVVCLYSPVDEDAPAAKRFYIRFGEKFDVDSCRVELSYSPAQAFLSAKARIRVAAKVEGLDSLKFRFSPDLEILKITDTEKRELFYTQDKLRQLLYVYLINPAPADAETSIEVYYRGRMVPPIPSTDAIGQAGGTERVLFQPRYETYFFTQAGYWYPSPPDEDYFQARLRIIVPPEYKCVAVGEMVEKASWEEMGDAVEIEKAGSAIYTFETRKPVKYLSFIVGKFEKRREWKEPVPIQTFLSSEVMNDSPGLFERARGILDFYIRCFGPFPYEKLGIIQRLWTLSGGHSPPSFIVLNQVPWDSGRRRAQLNTPVNLSQWDDYFLAHEIAHQWWGQGVSFSSYRDQWLSEGLAQFAAASYLREAYGERDFAGILKMFAKWTMKKSYKGPITMGSRLSFYDFDAYQAIVYDKAALSLFMLQDILGKDVFLAGLKAFFARNAYSAARTQDFVEAMEKVSGLDLADFFRGWFSSYELPQVRTEWSQEDAPEGARLKIRVTQEKGRFVFPLWVEWTSGGRTGREMVIIRDAVQEAVLAVPGHVDRVRFNPDREVPGRIY